MGKEEDYSQDSPPQDSPLGGNPDSGESWYHQLSGLPTPTIMFFLYIVCAWYGPWVSVGDTTQWFQYFYALFCRDRRLRTFKKICNIHVQNEGEVKGRLNNAKKNALFRNVGFPYKYIFFEISFLFSKNMSSRFLFLLSKHEVRISHFSLYSRIWDQKFKFLFLFLILLFGLSSNR